MEPGEIILYLVGIIAIIFAAYYTTYFISAKATGTRQNKGRNISVLERFAISKDKSFCIVKVCGKIYFVGITNQSMTILDNIDAEEFGEYSEEYNRPTQYAPFAGSKQKVINGLASFLAERMGKIRLKSDEKKKDSVTFGETLRAAKKNDGLQQPAPHSGTQTNSSDSPEGEG